MAFPLTYPVKTTPSLGDFPVEIQGDDSIAIKLVSFGNFLGCPLTTVQERVGKNYILINGEAHILSQNFAEVIKKFRHGDYQVGGYSRLYFLQHNMAGKLNQLNLKQPWIKEEKKKVLEGSLEEEASLNEVLPVMMLNLGLETVPAVYGRGFSEWMNNTEPYASWIRSHLEANPYFKQGIDYCDDYSGDGTVFYALSIKFAKHIAMQSPTTRGREVREYFIRCEEKFSQGNSFHGLENFVAELRSGAIVQSLARTEALMERHNKLRIEETERIHAQLAGLLNAELETKEEVSFLALAQKESNLLVNTLKENVADLTKSQTHVVSMLETLIGQKIAEHTGELPKMMAPAIHAQKRLTRYGDQKFYPLRVAANMVNMSKKYLPEGTKAGLPSFTAYLECLEYIQRYEHTSQKGQVTYYWHPCPAHENLFRVKRGHAITVSLDLINMINAERTACIPQDILELSHEEA